MGQGRALGRMPAGREVTTGAEPAAKGDPGGEEHGAARRHKQGAKSQSTGRVGEADGL